jgi:serine/threonine-protein kinase RsbW
MKQQLQAPSRNLNCVIPSRLDAVDAVCVELRRFMNVNGLAAQSFSMELIARECLNNAILHGNKRQEEKTARLSLRVGRRWLRLEVSDEGAGFNWRRARKTSAAPSATHGRGIAIGHQYANRVSFNRLGNRITLWLENCGSAKRHQNGKIHN